MNKRGSKYLLVNRTQDIEMVVVNTYTHTQIHTHTHSRKLNLPVGASVVLTFDLVTSSSLA